MRTNKELYSKSLKINEIIINKSYDYSNGNLLRNSLSSKLYENKILADFLDGISDIMEINVDSIKKIRVHNNISVDKNDIDIF